VRARARAQARARLFVERPRSRKTRQGCDAIEGDLSYVRKLHVLRGLWASCERAVQGMWQREQIKPINPAGRTIVPDGAKVCNRSNQTKFDRLNMQQKEKSKTRNKEEQRTLVFVGSSVHRLSVAVPCHAWLASHTSRSRLGWRTCLRRSG